MLRFRASHGSNDRTSWWSTCSTSSCTSCWRYRRCRRRYDCRPEHERPDRHRRSSCRCGRCSKLGFDHRAHDPKPRQVICRRHWLKQTRPNWRTDVKPCNAGLVSREAGLVIRSASSSIKAPFHFLKTGFLFFFNNTLRASAVRNMKLPDQSCLVNEKPASP